MAYAPTAPRQPTRSQGSPSSDWLNTWRGCPPQALRKLVAVRIYERSKNAAEPGLADRARQTLAEVDLTEQDVEEMYKLFAIAWRDRIVIHTNPRRCAN
jgi:nitrate reductase beta subunit